MTTTEIDKHARFMQAIKVKEAINKVMADMRVDCIMIEILNNKDKAFDKIRAIYDEAVADGSN